MIVHSVVAEQRVFLVLSFFLLLLVSCGVQPDPSTKSSEVESLGLRASYTRQFGTVNRDDVTALATDSSGNAYIAINTGFSAASETPDTAYIFSYDPSGNLLRSWNPSSCCGFWDNYVSGVVTDTSGNVYISGHFTDYFKTYFVYIEKYDVAGNLLWTKKFRETATSPLGDPTTMQANALSIDARGNLYLLFRKSFYPYQTPMVYARKYSSRGGLLWEKLINNSSPSVPPATLTADANGNIYTAVVCGYGVNRVDTCLSKFDTGGNPLWSLTLPSSVYQYVRGLTTDTTGNLFITG